MAKQSRKQYIPTKKHLAREQRERRQMRLLLIASLVVLGLVVALIGYGVLNELVLQSTRPVAVVNGERIRAGDFEDFTRYNRYLLIRNALQTYQFAEYFGNDPNTMASFQSQIMQIQGQLAPATAGEQALNQMIDAALVRQEADKVGITVMDEEIDVAVQEAFGYFPEGTPTPTATTEVFPTSTLSPQQLTLIPPTPTVSRGRSMNGLTAARRPSRSSSESASTQQTRGLAAALIDAFSPSARPPFSLSMTTRRGVVGDR